MRASLRVVLFALLLALLLLTPHVLWRLRAGRQLEVVIVDKTVPFRQYREHAALPWLLHALKLQGKSGRFLDAAHDYLGFDPSTHTGTDLSPADLLGVDALLIADTYGVYHGDYGRDGEQAALERSPLIYGGMTDDEASAVERFANKGGLVIGEFNTFASPTEDAPRSRLERVFGAHWTRWVGRYWPNLRDRNEVPPWVAESWQKLTQTPFNMSGPGLVLVRDDNAIVVLRGGEDLGENVLTQERTRAGEIAGLPPSASFRFWFDVLVPDDGEVLCEHVIDVTPSGAAKLAAQHLPSRFPAVVRRGTAWYLAGDFVDSAIELGTPELAGLLTWKSYLARVGGVPEERFFWGWYAPLVGKLLNDRAH